MLKIRNVAKNIHGNKHLVCERSGILLHMLHSHMLLKNALLSALQ